MIRTWREYARGMILYNTTHPEITEDLLDYEQLQCQSPDDRG